MNAIVTPGPEYLANGQSKAERFGWQIVDGPGELVWIDKNRLHVDESYQRDETPAKIKAIAAAWSWVACGAIIVGWREGVYWVIDGQHRVAAARRHAAIRELPCLVFQTADAKTEARGFLDANTLRKPITSMDRFKSLIAVDDPAALLVRGLLGEHGYTATNATNPGTRTVKCVTLLLYWAREDPALLTRTFPLIVEAAGGEVIYERVVDSILYIEQQLSGSDSGVSLARQPWRGRLVGLGSAGILEAAAKAAAFYARGGRKVWAQGVVEALNRGVRNRLALPGANNGGA
jgi:hypothetical protein